MVNERPGLCDICGRPDILESCMLCGARACRLHIRAGVCSRHPTRGGPREGEFSREGLPRPRRL